LLSPPSDLSFLSLVFVLIGEVEVWNEDLLLAGVVAGATVMAQVGLWITVAVTVTVAGATGTAQVGLWITVAVTVTVAGATGMAQVGLWITVAVTVIVDVTAIIGAAGLIW